MDFLILLPTGMELRRNESRYLEESSSLVADFLGVQDWREGWVAASKTSKRFDDFIVEMYCEQMKALGYHHGDLKDSALIRSTDKNLPLYRLVFFSRHKLGKRFWAEARKYANPQRTLF